MFDKPLLPISWLDLLRAQAQIAADTGEIMVLDGSWEDHWLPKSAQCDEMIISKQERVLKQRRTSEE